MKKWVKILPVFTVSICLLVPACSDSDKSTGPDSDDTQAQITIRSDPDPVPFTQDAGSTHYWYFDFYVEETAGVGATLTEWKMNWYDQDSNFLWSSDLTIQNFISWFTECDETDGHVNASGTVCCKPFWVSSTSNEEGFSIIVFMKFLDDNGHSFWATGHFTFSAVL